MNVSEVKKDRLGRGLGALLAEYLEEEAVDSMIRAVPVSSISPNPFQPRSDFNPAELEELAESINTNGLLQPLVVRAAPKSSGRYQLIAGERRWRAIRQLGWTEVPALLRDADDETLLVLAMVENLQREALGPLEEAEGYRLLTENFGLTQEQVASAVGKERSTVANFLRLLKLPPSVRKLVEDGKLSMGHARALLAMQDPVQAGDLARQAVTAGWSVREVERRVSGSARRASQTARKPVDPALRALEEELCQVLATKVHIRKGSKGRGTIEVPFYGAEDLERLFAIICGKEASDVVG